MVQRHSNEGKTVTVHAHLVIWTSTDQNDTHLNNLLSLKFADMSLHSVLFCPFGQVNRIRAVYICMSLRGRRCLSAEPPDLTPALIYQWT